MIMVAGDVIAGGHLALPGTSVPAAMPADDVPTVEPLHEARERFERDYILRTLSAQNGNMSRTAEVLGVERSNLYKKMRAYGILPAAARRRRGNGARACRSVSPVHVDCPPGLTHNAGRAQARMPNLPRYPSSRPAADDPPQGRDAAIEALLLAGLDHYFAGDHERAIHAWERVLFLDRGHRRARAYIDRARAVVAERQREVDARLHDGIEAFELGDADRARALFTSVVEDRPDDQALAWLQRMQRIAPAAIESLPDVADAAQRRPGRRRSRRCRLPDAPSSC